MEKWITVIRSRVKAHETPELAAMLGPNGRISESPSRIQALHKRLIQLQDFGRNE